MADSHWFVSRETSPEYCYLMYESFCDSLKLHYKDKIWCEWKLAVKQ